MCGITGVLNLYNREPIALETLKLSNKSLYHRGPNDEGVFINAKICMAMRRLSIIDVTGGHQPLGNENGTIQIVYNGEIYNHKTLRTELESLGHVFKTKSDTEAILHGYEQWGKEGVLDRLRGMFAFALWDGNIDSLFLARDRMGIKPLYYAEYDGKLYFASEIRALMILSGMPRQIDIDAFKAFMNVGFVTAPHTMFKGVNKIPSAHYLSTDEDHVTIHRYWFLSYGRKYAHFQRAEMIDRFNDIFKESVGMHLMSDVPLGALLSGGIDSSANVAFMQRILEKPVKTVTIGFEEKNYNEADLAAATARFLGAEHHHITFTGDMMDEYPKILFYREEPIADATFVALYYLFWACRQKNLTVVLTGEGADELFGGYYWHKAASRMRHLRRLPGRLRSLIAANHFFRSRGEVGRKMAYILLETSGALHQQYQDWIRIAEPKQVIKLLSKEIQFADKDVSKSTILESWAKHLLTITDQAEFNQILWLQSRTRMIDWVNHGLDRMSMAHSVEARPPFLDHKLWEFCAQLPVKLKLNSLYWNANEKYLLREATRGLVPETVRLRRKKALRVPFARWLTRRRLPDWAESALTEERLRQAGLFNPKAVLTLRRQHQEGMPDMATLLMGVIAMQIWVEIFLESPLTNGPPQL